MTQAGCNIKGGLMIPVKLVIYFPTKIAIE